MARSRSRSPPRRGGYDSSAGRRRSPPRGLDRDRDRDRDRPRDDGYSSRPGAGSSRGGGGGGSYTSADREREREGDRKRYDERNDRDRAREGGPVLEEPAPRKEAQPDFSNSGALAAETLTTADGVLLKYSEPPEARKPTLKWRLFVFKGKEQVDEFHIHSQSCYLVGRDSTAVEIALGHPSCSKQHAAFQHRVIREQNEYGDVNSNIKPFIIDLESTNGTYVNDKEIPTSRYYELKASDVIKFGQSSREYVLLHDDA